MLARVIVAALAAALIAPAAATAQALPNPVPVFYGYRGEDKTYAVDCWSSPGVRGAWQQVFGSTYTDREALIYRPAPELPPKPPHPSILYCSGADGKPGTIQGAPQGMLLPPGTRVISLSSAQITMEHIENGNRLLTAMAVPLDESTTLHSGPEGIVVRSGPHEAAVYPAGSTLTVGEGGESAGYLRPGHFLAIPERSSQSGCSVTFVDSTGGKRTQHYPQDCAAIDDARLWEKR